MKITKFLHIWERTPHASGKFDVFFRVLVEPMLALGTAEIIRNALKIGGVKGRVAWNPHATNGVLVVFWGWGGTWGFGRFDECQSGRAAHLNDFCQNADGNFFGKTSFDVESCGGFDLLNASFQKSNTASAFLRLATKAM